MLIMDSTGKFFLPSPNFVQHRNEATLMKGPHYLTPCGMTLLPREKQPPPMYGMRGATVPAKFLPMERQKPQQQNRHYQSTGKATTEEEPSAALYFCEACDLACTTEEHLRHHRAQHEGCPINGCTYRGHPMVMDKHVMALHSSGLFDTLKKLSTPEEIAAWREERRKKYPTVANVQMRQLVKEQRQKRGERLEVNRSRFGKAGDRRGMSVQKTDKATEHTSGRERKYQRNKKKRGNKESMNVHNKPHGGLANRHTSVGKLEVSEENEIPNFCNIIMFRGTSKMKNYKHLNKKQKTEANALSNLLAMYGSDSESNDSTVDSDEEDRGTITDEKVTAAQICEDNKANSQVANELMETDIVEVQAANYEVYPTLSSSRDEHNKLSTAVARCQNPEENTKFQSESTTTICSSKKSPSRSSDEAPEEIPIEHTNNLSTVPVKQTVATEAPLAKRTKTEPAKFERIVRKSGLNYRQTNLRKQNTLLEKLLEPDIRHERNVLLQCVRYVCNNDFFGVTGSGF